MKTPPMKDFKALLEEQVKKAAANAPAVTAASRTKSADPVSVAPPAEKSLPKKPVEAPPEEEDRKLQPETPRTLPKEEEAVAARAETASEAAPEREEEEEDITTPKARGVPTSRSGANRNRVTVNLFESDKRALAVIKEKLESQGLDFTNRSDSMKIGLRLAMKASREELAALLGQVRAEDKRFKNR